MTNETNIDFQVTTTSRSSSEVEMSRRERYPLFQRGLGGFSSQSPEDFISYNRYAYCLYNPFKYTDPSGEHPLVTNEDASDDDARKSEPNENVVEVVAYRCYSTSNQFLNRPSFFSRENPFTRRCSWAGSSLGKKGASGSSQYGGAGASYTSDYAKNTLRNKYAGDGKPLISIPTVTPINVPQSQKGPIYASPDFFGEQSITLNNPELDIFLAFTMAGDALLITKGIIRGGLEAAASRALGREGARLADEIGEWLGKGATKHFNKA
ncbi:MAG: hypothetical protein WCR42_02690, partial [bacterium]